MNKTIHTKIYAVLALTLVLAYAAVGCGAPSRAQEAEQTVVSASSEATDLLAEGSAQPTEANALPEAGAEPAANEAATKDEAAVSSPAELEVRFGDAGEPFVMNLEDNATAAAIARHVGTTDWRLPIYNHDGFENADVMQYYDIPERYEIPSDPQAVTAERAGEVYYSDPNRIVLFYGDAEISGEYTKIGSFDYSEEFAAAVRENPELEGWGNKIILISDGQ